jgi:serine/threonine protein kinase
MELAAGSLQDYIKSRPIDDDSMDDDSWSIMLQIGAGLKFLHQRQMIHRDLKPANSTTPFPSPLCVG